MSHNVEIKVFPLAKTEVDWEEALPWLEHLGVNLDTHVEGLKEVSECGTLVGLAAKRCYMSFEPGLNPNVTKVRQDWSEFLTNLLESGHGSVLEHATWTWAIEGVSRVFTGEMNRHRAGVAISEGSMRYIRFDDIPWWLPKSLEAEYPTCPEDVEYEEKASSTRTLFKGVFEAVEVAYEQLCKIWDIDNQDFARKKVLTSLFRRIIPMGVATGGVWTMNLRALRHVITLRSSPEAEEEIAYVMGLIAKTMVEEECNLFGDFKQDEQGFWRPKYVKV